MRSNRPTAMKPGAFSGIFVSSQLGLNSCAHIQSLYQYAGPSWTLNVVKGSVLERALPGIMGSGFLEKTGAQWTSITPHRSGPSGIDALFIRTKNGRPVSLMVAEAKYGSSMLSMTRDGRQMSEAWIRPRLIRTAGIYHKVAQALKSYTVVRGASPRVGGIQVPLPNGSQATLSIVGNTLFVASPSGVSLQTLERQVRSCGDLCLGAGEGKIDYRSRLFRMKANGMRWSFAIDKLDPVSGHPIGNTSQIEGEYLKLPKDIQRLMRQNLASTLRSKGLPREAADGLADQICNNPSMLKRTQLVPQANWRIGINRGMAYSAGVSVLMALLAESVGFISGRSINGKRLAKTALASGLSAGSGYYIGAQVQSRMISTEVGKRLAGAMPTAGTAIKFLGGYEGLASGVITSVLFAGIGYSVGLLSAREAKVTAASGAIGTAAGLGFTYGTVAVVTTYGTAGTGAAISTLSGAAASNSVLALLGGGTVASGGGGMAVGATILSGGAVLIGFMACGTFALIINKLDARERRLLAIGRMTIFERSLKNQA